MILGNFRSLTVIANIWNRLPNAVVDEDSLDLFTVSLNNFCFSQDVKYDYPTLSTLLVSEIDRSMTLKLFEKL